MRINKVLLFIFIIFLAACGASGDDSGAVEDSDAVKEESDEFPNQLIKIVVGFKAGGGADMGARIIAEELGKNFDSNEVSVVVENKPGGAGVVAMTEIINEKGDGYTIGYTPNGPMNIQPHFGHTTYEYDEATPISHVASTPFVLAVHKDSPWDDFDSFLQDVIDNPGQYAYGHPGVGTAGELSMLYLAREEGIDIKAVPFEGSAPARTALMAKDVDMISVTKDEVESYALDGELKLLLNLSQKEIEDFPDLPKAVDKGYDMDFIISNFFYGPKELPDDIRDKIDNALKKTIENEEVIESMKQMGFTIHYLNSEETKEVLEEQYNTNEELIEIPK